MSRGPAGRGQGAASSGDIYALARPAHNAVSGTALAHSGLMTVNEFLVRHVDEQILGDLEAMATLAATGKQGEVGYPIVMTVFSGCELLGRLMVPGNTRAAFVSYWVEHLYPGTDRAGAEALYRLVRSGAGPGFVAMPGIRVTTSRSQDHLSMADGAFVIDALTLDDDFRASYTAGAGRSGRAGRTGTPRPAVVAGRRARRADPPPAGSSAGGRVERGRLSEHGGRHHARGRDGRRRRAAGVRRRPPACGAGAGRAAGLSRAAGPPVSVQSQRFADRLRAGAESLTRDTSVRC